jgi:hypothetical protein
MRLITIVLLFISSICFAKTNLTTGASATDSFSAEVALDNPMSVVIKNVKTQKTQTMNFKYSVSDTKKLNLTKSNSKNVMELLLVVLSVSNAEQSVLVLAPGRTQDQLCSLSNQGDFSFDSDNDLKERLKITTKGSQEILQIKIGKRVAGKTQFSWMDCAAL